jgi:polyisoprenyl-teichoic acid--peptidoglycan teichoic acid transferase
MTFLRNFLVFLCSVAVVVAVANGVRHPNLFPALGANGSVLDPLPRPLGGVHRLRLVLIGADDRPGAPGRSDTLMVLLVNAATQRAVLLSIPRDLRAAIPGHGEDKINHAYHFGGPKLTRQTVEGLLNQPMDGYVKINLQGFVKAIDILGGVVMDVEDREGKGRGMNYDCPGDNLVIHLKPGVQRLNGYKSMCYVRYRKSNVPGAGDSDLQRAARQQKFIKAVIMQKLKVNQIPALLKAGHSIYRAVNTNLSWRQVLDLGRLLRQMPPESMTSMTVPVLDHPSGGVYYSALDEEKSRQQMAEAEAFLDAQGAALAQGTAQATATDRGPVLVEVLNGCGEPGVGTAAAEKLRAAGFEVLTIGNAGSFRHSRTTVLYKKGSGPQAKKAIAALGCGTARQDADPEPAAPGTVRLQITVGKDFPGRK